MLKKNIQLDNETKDINHSEPIEYLIPAVSDDEIKKFLIDKAKDIDLL
jgi:hypothetical protein